MFSLSEVLGKVADVFNPIEKLVDNLHTSTEEKLTLKNQLVSMQNEVAKGQMLLLGKALDLESEALKAKQAIIVAEAQSQSWIANNWRPITMLNFVAITTLHALGYINMDADMSAKYFSLVEIGLGGYVMGRTLEKVAPAIAQVVKK